jgi:hypothetical protein
MNLKEMLLLEIKRMREDIEGSTVIQDVPYINKNKRVWNPKKHLIGHCDNIQRLVEKMGDDIEK